jgi:uncharacterized repeat protein (TIGR02543 family)
MKGKILKQIELGIAAVVMALGAACFPAEKVFADKGSAYEIFMRHVPEKCDACGETEFAQKVLTGSTHTFTLLEVPAALQGIRPVWTLEGGQTELAEIVESTDTYCKVKFLKAGNSGFSDLHVNINVSFEVPGQFAYADYWVGVFDRFYHDDQSGEYGRKVVLEKGDVCQLQCKTVVSDLTHPTGHETTVNDAVWEISSEDANQGVTVSSAGKVNISSACPSGEYLIWMKEPSGKFIGSRNIWVVDSVLKSGENAAVKAGEEKIYRFCPKTTGKYTFYGLGESPLSDVLLTDENGTPMTGTRVQVSEDQADQYGTDAGCYQLTAGKCYYVGVLLKGLMEGEKNVMVSAPASPGTDSTPDKQPETDTEVHPNPAPNPDEKPAAKQYTVKFLPNGGKVVGAASKKVTKNAKYGKLPTASRKKYSFKGWYTKKKGGIKITSSKKATISKNQTLYAQWSKVKAPAKPKAPVLKNLKGRKLSIKLKKVSQAKGYEISYSTNAKWKGAKKTFHTGLNKTVKNLKKGKTYYVRVRAYGLDSAKTKIFGPYSKAIKIKITK